MPNLPATKSLQWPVLCALRDLGGSATVAELDSKVMENENYSEAQQSVLHGDGPRTEINYRLAWARTYLKNIGLVENSARTVWSLTDDGHEIDRAELKDRYLNWRSPKSNSSTKKAEPAILVDSMLSKPKEQQVSKYSETEFSETEWQEELLDQLMLLPPDGFERLTQRLLRESGFVDTQVMGRTGDGGIDGRGAYRLSLLTFQVFFQCKRYKGSVGAPQVRDFRGAMAGRGDKGLLITTGVFTNEAKKEASRDGAPPIDLIDGTQLCELIKERELGVTVRTRTIEEVKVNTAFFDKFR